MVFNDLYELKNNFFQVAGADVIGKKYFFIPNCQRLDYSVEFCLRTNVSAILKKVKTHVFSNL